jgi:hypothetical protein
VTPPSSVHEVEEQVIRRDSTISVPSALAVLV